jgi:hypothetical protein
LQFHDGWELGESKAWQELAEERGINYEYVAYHMQRVLVVITDPGPNSWKRLVTDATGRKERPQSQPEVSTEHNEL